MKLETLLAQAGSRWDTRTGAVSAPIYQVAAFRHPELGQSTGFDYSRTANPTRSVLEETMAALEGGVKASAFSSGLAALDAVLRLFKPGDRILATEDPYGGSARLFDAIYKIYGLETAYVDTSDTAAVAAAFAAGPFAALFVEMPTNPLLRVADVAAVTAIAREHSALVIVDNTFLTPVLFRPFAHGADIVLYSATKYLCGHNDVVAGLAVSRTEELGSRIAFIQNAAGAILGPMDSWLLLRGMKTLAVRLARQEQNAHAVAAFLERHPRVPRVYYPGLPSDPGHALLARQADGFGAMLSFEVETPDRIPYILKSVQVFLFAESLGGTESLVTFPAVQTHADMAPELRDRLGINDKLLRLSIGLENPDDLVADLARVLE